MDLDRFSEWLSAFSMLVSAVFHSTTLNAKSCFLKFVPPLVYKTASLGETVILRAVGCDFNFFIYISICRSLYMIHKVIIGVMIYKD